MVQLVVTPRHVGLLIRVGAVVGLFCWWCAGGFQAHPSQDWIGVDVAWVLISFLAFCIMRSGTYLDIAARCPGEE